MNHAASLNARAAFEHQIHRFSINAMLLFEDARGERFRRVVVKDGNDGLQDDGAGVKILIHEMNSATRKSRAKFQGLALRFKSGEGRQQRGVNIQDASTIRGNKKGRKQTHVSRETNEIDVVFLKHGGNLLVVGFALQSLGRNNFGGNSARGSSLDPRRPFPVADDHGNFRVWDTSRGNAISQRLKV